MEGQGSWTGDIEVGMAWETKKKHLYGQGRPGRQQIFPGVAKQERQRTLSSGVGLMGQWTLRRVKVR